MHQEVKTYCESIKEKFPEYFKGKTVLDVGSLDINGNNRYLFEDCVYWGIDLGEGQNVNQIFDISEGWCGYRGNGYDIVISTEMLEHCRGYNEAMENMLYSLKSGGLLLFTAAGEGRTEHGTTRSDPQSAPFTNDHYHNILESDIIEALDPDNNFSEWEISKINQDIRFYGIKK